MVQPIPEGYEHLMAYIVPKDAAAAIDFYTRVFGAEELVRMPGRDGGVGHAELRIGRSVLMLADEPQEPVGYVSAESLGGTTFTFILYVQDADALYRRALEAGAESVMEPATQFYGDRQASVRDPFGYLWTLMTHVEDVSPEEMQRRMADETGQGSA